MRIDPVRLRMEKEKKLEVDGLFYFRCKISDKEFNIKNKIDTYKVLEFESVTYFYFLDNNEYIKLNVYRTEVDENNIYYIFVFEVYKYSNMDDRIIRYNIHVNINNRNEISSIYIDDIKYSSIKNVSISIWNNETRGLFKIENKTFKNLINILIDKFEEKIEYNFKNNILKYEDYIRIDKINSNYFKDYKLFDGDYIGKNINTYYNEYLLLNGPKFKKSIGSPELDNYIYYNVFKKEGLI